MLIFTKGHSYSNSFLLLVPMKKAVMVFFLHLLFISCSTNTKDFNALFPCTAILEDAYGICSHVNKKGSGYEFDNKDKELQMINDVGASFVRTVWDWPLMMTSSSCDSLSFVHYNEVMETINRYDKKVLAIVTLRPDFIMKDTTLWGKHIEKEVDYYRTIHYWEIINEADIIKKWHPNILANEYVHLLKIGSRSVKSSNSSASVLLSGIANTDSPFLDAVLKSQVGEYFDIMNVHRYCQKNNEPEELIEYYTRLRDKLKAYSIYKPVWLTECGCTTAEGWVSEIIQAQRLPRIYLISFALGIDKVFWYKSRSNEEDPHNKEGYFGLWHKDYTPKPSYYSYKALTKMCPEGSKRPRLVRWGNIYMAHWEKPDGKKVFAIWTSKSSKTIVVHSNLDYLVYDLYGNLIENDEEKKVVTPSIKFYEGASEMQLSFI